MLFEETLGDCVKKVNEKRDVTYCNMVDVNCAVSGQRDFGIDILKFIAVILITNSHFDKLYPGAWSYLGTGGAIGDALFFFCSGYTLFLKPMGRFDSWYKKRIRRIYPSVIMWALLSAVVFSSPAGVDDAILYGAWFISCIMIYYVFIYLINRLWLNKIIFAVLFIVTIVVYHCIEKPHNYNIYGDTYLKWVFFFMFMLLGAFVGKERKKTYSIMTSFILTFVSILAYYAILIVCKIGILPNCIQLLSLLFLLSVIYNLYALFSTKMASLFASRYARLLVMFIGGLCLEIYLVQNVIIRLSESISFPLNAFVASVAIVFLAWVLKVLSRFFMQTFDKDNYDWRKIFSLM